MVVEIWLRLLLMLLLLCKEAVLEAHLMLCGFFFP